MFEPCVAFDFSQSAGSVAVLTQQVCRWIELPERKPAEQLLPALAEIMKSLDLRPRDLKLVAVGTGPGSFSGLRASIASAQGLSLATNCAAVGIPSLQGLARLLVTRLSVVAPSDDLRGPIDILVPSVAGQAYFARFHATQAKAATSGAAILTHELRCQEGPREVTPSSYFSTATTEPSSDVHVSTAAHVGVTSTELWEMAQTAEVPRPPTCLLSIGRLACAVAVEAQARMRTQGAMDLEAIVPHYVRPSYAKMNPAAQK